MACEFGEVPRDVVTQAELVRFADGQAVFGIEQQPGTIVGHVGESGARAGERKRALAAARLTAEQDSDAVPSHARGVQGDHVALRQHADVTDGTWRACEMTSRVYWSSHETHWYRPRSRARSADFATGAWIRPAGYSDTRAGSRRHECGVLAGERRPAQAASLRATGPPGDHSRGHPAVRAPVSHAAGKRASLRGVAQRMPVATRSDEHTSELQ